MIFRALLLITLCGGLFYFGDLKIRYIALFGIYALIAPWLFFEILGKKRAKILQLCLACLLLLLSCIWIVISQRVIDVGLNFTYSILYLSGFSTFLLFAMSNILYRVELNKFIGSVSVIVISFAALNMLFILYTPDPYSTISLFTGTPIENFSRLDNRLLMPFGHPAQLGLVAACSIFALTSLRQTISVRLITFLLLSVIFLTFSNSIYIPVILIFLAIYFKNVLKDRNLLLYIPTFTFIAVSALLLLLYFELGFYFRDISNISESSNRHIMLRLQTIEAISQFGVYEWLFGIGAGQSRFYIEGSYSFTVLLTLLLEGGLLLLTVQLLYLASLAGYCKTDYSWAVWWLVFISSLFYQVNNDISFYIFPLVCILTIESNNDKDTGKFNKSEGRRSEKHRSAISS